MVSTLHGAFGSQRMAAQVSMGLPLAVALGGQVIVLDGGRYPPGMSGRKLDRSVNIGVGTRAKLIR